MRCFICSRTVFLDKRLVSIVEGKAVHKACLVNYQRNQKNFKGLNLELLSDTDLAFLRYSAEAILEQRVSAKRKQVDSKKA
ncbi:hypothetical protein HF888_15170 [Bermanella marisrubri]|uniref:Alanine racemase n=1 Tax=Bermanella marisrubri TaxID=207949 RepID=Q1N2K7_9GAMM|nr:hypothetical protein [Bermanella marisrubri]EAT12400.1 alanine racemase [Oceanobacter sp. RED65] [Bermanella marisrubri]QIZ85481.1 hypothetical protein HF888_15170 [Bermanella marisrubri]